MQAMLQRHSQVAAAAATRNFLRSSTRGKQHGSYKFVDRIKVAVRGGRGGNGCRSYEILSPAKKRPSGGNGGKGGNVYIVADKEVTNLNFETIAFNAGDGGNGSSKQMTGRNGKDIIIKVPLGTVVRNDYSREEEMSDHDTMLEMFGIDDPQQKPPPDPVFTMKEDGLRKTTYNGFEWEEIRVGEDESDENYVGNADDDQEEIDDDSENDIQFDLQTHGEKLLVARGGRAGMGNAAMARIAKLVKRSSPASKSPGEVGQARDLMLELKTIADVGLVGFPNAGKSTLLAALSNAKPKIANYAFTTLHPSVGIVEFSDLERITVADIPGIIDGAHENRGLGHDFLKHIERTKVILYVLDGTQASLKQVFGNKERTLESDFETLVQELEMYHPELLDRPALVLVNKIDCEGSESVQSISGQFKLLVARHSQGLMFGSAQSGKGMGEVAARLRLLVEKNEIDVQALQSKAMRNLDGRIDSLATYL